MDYRIGDLSGFIIAWIFQGDFFPLSGIESGLIFEDLPGGELH